jgi:hypothetical protein
MNGVALAYSGVHQIYQLALAAHEIGELDGLFCSMIDGGGKWGGKFSRWLPAGTVRPLGYDALPLAKVTEFPWPVLVNRLKQRLLPGMRNDHRRSNHWFDRTAARWLAGTGAKVFVGAETCALESLRAARSLGMKTVLDCPGIPSMILDEEARKGATAFDVTIPASSNSAVMLSQKSDELSEADLVICCSDYQRGKLLDRNPQVRRAEVIPLWADVDFWRPVVEQRHFSAAGQPLRVLYAGALSLRKGVPYLLQAVEPLSREIVLTLAGATSPEMTTILPRFRPHEQLPYLPKSELRSLFARHDVLVMPSLGDSFGFVTIEAMASGLPVITSQNVGAPVPAESWRVPAHDAGALRSRLLAYHVDREMLCADGEAAAAFAADFRPASYRAKAGKIFAELLSS